MLFLCCISVALFQVDVYSFGVIMWEVASHEQPARGRMRNLRVPQECPAEIDNLVTRCLSEDPESRPTAREAYGILKEWRDRQAEFLMHKRASMERHTLLERQSRDGLSPVTLPKPSDDLGSTALSSSILSASTSSAAFSTQ